MKWVKMKRKMTAFLLAMAMGVCVVSPAGAFEPSPAPTGTPAGEIENRGGASNGTTASDLGIEDEDLFISEDVARYIAEYFVEDMIRIGNTAWEAGTSFVDTVPMYDQTGENITAYTVRFTEGYVTVSAYVDMPNIILEWSDESCPVYEESLITAQSEDGFGSEPPKILYTGTLEYYIDSAEEEVRTVDGDQVDRTDISNSLDEFRDIDNVGESTLLSVAEYQEQMEQYANIPSVATDGPPNTPTGYIEKVMIYAHNVYCNTGVWECVDWANYWLDYVGVSSIMSDFGGYYEHCGPVAITNMIKMYGRKYNNDSINGRTPQQVFNEVIDANNRISPRPYINMLKDYGGGMAPKDAKILIDLSFYTYRANVSTYGLYDITLENIKNAVGTENRLMYVNLFDHSYYQKHAVVGYAYNVLHNYKYEGSDKAFLKICDGWSTGTRFLDVRMLEMNNSIYWELYCDY